MEILILVLLYYLSQNPDFANSVKPLMNQIKNSEEMLRFLNDLSKFTQTFSTFANEKPCDTPGEKKPKTSNESETQKKEPQSPTTGIADTFIQNILDSYLNKTN
jgi:hypothetical protein